MKDEGYRMVRFEAEVDFLFGEPEGFKKNTEMCSIIADYLREKFPSVRFRKWKFFKIPPK